MKEPKIQLINQHKRTPCSSEQGVYLVIDAMNLSMQVTVILSICCSG